MRGDVNSHELIHIYDTTLRDGAQREGISFSCEDKLRVARCLDKLGVVFIEGGWPGSNPKDAEFFERARAIPWREATIVAFGSTRRPNIPPEQDVNLLALLDAGTQVCTLVGKSSPMHVLEVLRATLDENLRMIEDSVGFLRSKGRRVIYDAEHFFDGYRSDPDYAMETLSAAARGGAKTIVLCDTNGGMMPWEIHAIVREVSKRLDLPLGIHAHDDAACGVANSLAAVLAGAVQVQGTINGYGERCGNANLCAVIPSLELKLGFRALPEGRLKRLRQVGRFVAEIANIAPDEHMPYVGSSAFSHKGGLHVAAMRRNAHSYQHVDPAAVGNETRVTVSELSGRANLLSKIEEYGLASMDAYTASEILRELKELEAKGFSFEAADASVAMMIQRRAPSYEPPFELIDYVVMVEHRQRRETFAEATVKLSVRGEVLHTAAEGNGPVHALDAALRKALSPIYPAMRSFQLVDYKVRILDGRQGTAAMTRVLIDTRDGRRRWSTVGASTNIIEASWLALADSIEYGLVIECGRL